MLSAVSARWRGVRRLLCVRLDNLGDLLMTTPAMRAIRESVPGVHVCLLASRSGAVAARYLPEVDEAIGYDAPWVKHDAPDAEHDEAGIVARIAAERFDAAIVFTVCTQSAMPAALMLHMAGVPLRLAHARENPYRLLTDWVPEPDGGDSIRHEVRRQLDLVAAVGMAPRHDRMSFRYPSQNWHSARARLIGSGIDVGRSWAVVHPGATAPSRRYPAPAFGEAARGLARRTGCQIVFTGSAAEQGLVGQALQAMGDVPAVSLAGRLDLGELAAVIDHADVLVSNNSGPVHIAAALGTPVVDLYALTNPQHTPWRVLHRVLNVDVDCKYCYRSVCSRPGHPCLADVAPASVADAAAVLIAASARPDTVRRIEPVLTPTRDAAVDIAHGSLPPAAAPHDTAGVDSSEATR